VDLVFVRPNGMENGAHEDHRGRILVVDRDPNVRDTVESLLTITGCDVTTAASAAAGLRFVRVWSPELILLDPMIRGPNPVDVVRQFWEAGRGSIPLILLVGDEMRADSALEPMVVDSLPKPFDVRGLVDLVGRYVICNSQA
jgi:two-component system, OmpR family, response regulator ResD